LVRQATQKEVADARKKKKDEESRRKYEKEKEITRRMKARENRSDVESELESEDPTEVGDDMIFSKEEESQEVIATSAERHNPAPVSTAGGQEIERLGDVPAPRKRAASMDTVSEREAKRTRSPRHLEVSPSSSPPATGTAEQARRSEEQVCTRASSGSAPTRDSQREDAPPAALVSVP